MGPVLVHATPQNRDAKASLLYYPEHFEKRGAVGVGVVSAGVGWLCDFLSAIITGIDTATRTTHKIMMTLRAVFFCLPLRSTC